MTKLLFSCINVLKILDVGLSCTVCTIHDTRYTIHDTRESNCRRSVYEHIVRVRMYAQHRELVAHVSLHRGTLYVCAPVACA